MFQEFVPLITERAVLLRIAIESDGRLSVSVLPQLNKDEKDDDPVTQGKRIPLHLTGSPQELDQEFVGAISSYLEKRRGFNCSVEALDSIFSEKLEAIQAKQKEKLEGAEKQAKAKAPVKPAEVKNYGKSGKALATKTDAPEETVADEQGTIADEAPQAPAEKSGEPDGSLKSAVEETEEAASEAPVSEAAPVGDTRRLSRTAAPPTIQRTAKVEDVLNRVKPLEVAAEAPAKRVRARARVAAPVAEAPVEMPAAPEDLVDDGIPVSAGSSAGFDFDDIPETVPSNHSYGSLDNDSF